MKKEMGELVFLNSSQNSIEAQHYKLLIDSGLYKEILVPINVDLRDTESELTWYYCQRLKEEYTGPIIILDNEKVFISKDMKE